MGVNQSAVSPKTKCNHENTKLRKHETGRECGGKPAALRYGSCVACSGLAGGEHPALFHDPRSFPSMPRPDAKPVSESGNLSASAIPSLRPAI